ncbi:hypothetical protein [Sphingomonas sp. VNH70]|uniref:hypothetical protein n=1 Tax=Sphingomonas silueang TaxID=3156617 RepID=UPI0032B5C071
MPTARTRSHPFRRRLSPVAAAPERPRDESDLKLFAVSFTAFFLCFYTFLL